MTPEEQHSAAVHAILKRIRWRLLVMDPPTRFKKYFLLGKACAYAAFVIPLSAITMTYLVLPSGTSSAGKAAVEDNLSNHIRGAVGYSLLAGAILLLVGLLCIVVGMTKLRSHFRQGWP